LLALPRLSVSTEIIFGGDDERLSTRHDAGSTPAPYVAGTLLGIRSVRECVSRHKRPRPALPRIELRPNYFPRVRPELEVDM
jgi:hypothetical protein